MISLTKLLFDEDYTGDGYRYTYRAGMSKNGVSEGRGPIVVWNSTRTCNLHCRHCYMNSEGRRYRGELNTAEAKSFIDALADFKVPALLFSGGEPLLRDDFFELVEYVSVRGIRPTVSTNGTLITLEIAKRIKEAGVSYVGVSLDGLEHVNDDFRGHEGAFVAAMNGIRACVEAGQRVGLRFTINRHNIAELDNIFDFIERENIDRVCFYHLVYSGRGQLMVDDDVSPPEARKAMEKIVLRTKDFAVRGLKKEILTVDNHADGPYLYLLAKQAGDIERADKIMEYLRMNGGNRSGMAFAEVDPEGYVHPDQFTQHHIFGNVKERAFGEIWSSTANELQRGLKNRKGLLKGRCRTCRFLEVCNGNFRTRAEAKTGDFWESDPACYLTDEEIKGDVFL